ncbi:hypothetical protein PCL_02217 [Purpureocillium lilacinum]|uniref:Uncharacterized protein n=1 Tax=Purpureocillium lilacinum TaxID=33203 RepID=A0A2U3E1R7_PURLI|nr:hypothetical protein PCL_02217 [Purpureocillium lilacinum]
MAARNPSRQGRRLSWGGLPRSGASATDMHDLEDLRLQHGARRTRTRAGAASLPSSSSSVSWEGQGEGRARLLQKSFGLDDKILPRIILTSGAVSDCITAPGATEGTVQHQGMDGGPPSASARLTLDREAWAQRSRRMECCEPAVSASIGQEGVIIRRHHHHRHYTPPPTAALLANPALPVIDYQAVPPRTPGLLRAQQPPTPTDTESLTHQRLPIPCLHRPTTAQFRYCSLCPQYPQDPLPAVACQSEMSRRRPVGTRKRRDANIHTHTHQAMSRVSPGANPSSSVSVRHSASSHHPSMMRPRRAVCRDGGADGQGRGMAQRALLQRRMQRTSHAAPRRLASGQLLARASLQAPLRLCQERLLAKRIVTTCPSPLHRHSPEQKIGARPAQCARVDTDKRHHPFETRHARQGETDGHPAVADMRRYHHLMGAFVGGGEPVAEAAAAEARVYFHVARGGLEAWAMDGMMGSRLVVFVATRLPPSFNLDPAKFLLLNIRWIIPRVAALSKPEAAWLAGPEEELPAQRCRVAVAMRSSIEAPIRPAPDASMTVWKIAGRPMEVAGDLSRLFQWMMQQKVNPFLFAGRSAHHLSNRPTAGQAFLQGKSLYCMLREEYARHASDYGVQEGSEWHDRLHVGVWFWAPGLQREIGLRRLVLYHFPSERSPQGVNLLSNRDDFIQSLNDSDGSMSSLMQLALEVWRRQPGVGHGEGDVIDDAPVLDILRCADAVL